MSRFETAPIQNQTLTQKDGTVDIRWRRWFDLIPPAITPPGSQQVPTAANSPTTKSGMACDDNFFYVMTPSGIWKKIALSNL
jgi:hypothetical protein